MFCDLDWKFLLPILFLLHMDVMHKLILLFPVSFKLAELTKFDVKFTLEKLRITFFSWSFPELYDAGI